MAQYDPTSTVSRRSSQRHSESRRLLRCSTASRQRAVRTYWPARSGLQWGVSARLHDVWRERPAVRAILSEHVRWHPRRPARIDVRTQLAGVTEALRNGGTAMKLPRLASGFTRVVAVGDSATTGVQPAFNISCHCNGPAKDLNWSCECNWWGGGCWGSSISYVDGSWESHYGCSAKS